MATLVLLNPSARRARTDLLEMKAALASAPSLDAAELVVTDGAGEAAARASRAVDDGWELVVAAGGDGTVRAVVQGLMSARAGEGRERSRAGPTLAVVPLGTGNDLARSLGLPRKPRDALRALESARRVTMDILEVRGTEDDPWYCANVVDGGFSGQVEESMRTEFKETLGSLAYLRTALEVLGDLEPYPVRIALDGGDDRRDDVYNVAMANGRYVGGGVPVAPRARIDDGLLDLIVVSTRGEIDAGELAERIVEGEHLRELGPVRFARGREVEISSARPMPWSVDGELVGRTRELGVRVLPGALTVLAGDEEGAAA